MSLKLGASVLENPGATPATLVLHIDTRSQRVPQAESDPEEENRMKLISGVVRAALPDLDKDKFIEQLQNSCNNKYTPSAKTRRKGSMNFDIQRQETVIACVGLLFLKTKQIPRHSNKYAS